MIALLGRWKAAFLAGSIRSQLLILLALGQVLAHASTIVIVSTLLSVEDRVNAVRSELSDAFVGALTVLDPDADLAQVAQKLVAHDPRFRIDAMPAPERDRLPDIADLVRTNLPEHWHEMVSAVSTIDQQKETGPEDEPFALILDLGGGDVLWFYPDTDLLSRTFPLIGIAVIVSFLAVPLTLLAIWSGAYLIKPVERLAKGAERFASDVQAGQLDETGPREVRTAIVAFNAMQDRLRAMIEDRAQTLASIGHDMRTPLTRLRLRLEDVPLGETETGVRSDIAAMEVMIDDALEFIRSESKRVDLGPVNIDTLCQTVVNEMVDQGHDVRCEGVLDDHVICDIHLTVRALSNLLENAVKFAGRALVEIRGSAQNPIIAVVDEGPGIPDALWSIATKPFNRAAATDAGLPEQTKGFGLGLAIVQDCMTRQNGALVLKPNTPSGLIAELHLPKTT